MQAQNIEPRQMHYACMVDLLGRAGLMEDAVELINNLPMILDANIWGALLGACRIHGNIELASWAAEHLFKLRPQHSGYYILLANMYAEAGKWDEANRVRGLMKLKGAKKSPACSWVQNSDQLHAFVVGEKLDSFALAPSPVAQCRALFAEMELVEVCRCRLATKEVVEDDGGAERSGDLLISNRSVKRRIVRRSAQAPAVWIETMTTLMDTLQLT
ncbi:hypothetical protein JRO89_XS10G0104800 [Xanthoceras sorbifolium]|uniref:Pentatricopeptide repeat-containing protein n=1 Tax=Xanthoceras sorbifolium TaxID=99658 RepID=A0ABQ8HI96_9ROSI|nr:hypothetical protein JRO89_XS10G0104800 [Xanthoceras sorbifolium]